MHLELHCKRPVVFDVEPPRKGFDESFPTHGAKRHAGAVRGSTFKRSTAIAVTAGAAALTLSLVSAPAASAAYVYKEPVSEHHSTIFKANGHCGVHDHTLQMSYPC